MKRFKIKEGYDKNTFLLIYINILQEHGKKGIDFTVDYALWLSIFQKLWLV